MILRGSMAPNQALRSAIEFMLLENIVKSPGSENLAVRSFDLAMRLKSIAERNDSQCGV
jgi:hypothetical protein